jgi:hypothetical protein
MSTPFVMSSMKEEKFRKEIEFKLVTRVLGEREREREKEKGSQELLISGLKCAIELIKREWVTSVKCFT